MPYSVRLAHYQKEVFIVLGIKEADSRFEIKGIVNNKELEHRFGQKIQASPS